MNEFFDVESSPFSIFTESSILPTIGPESIAWSVAANDTSYQEYTEQLTCLLTSHVAKFMSFFGESFISWVEWMKTDNPHRLEAYLEQIRFDVGDQDLTAFLNLEQFSQRLEIFLNQAAIVCNERGGEDFGFVPRALHEYAHCYPFHLLQIVRTSVCEFKGDTMDHLIQFNSVASDVWSVETGVKVDLGPYKVNNKLILEKGSGLIPSIAWSNVYTSRLDADYTLFEYHVAQSIDVLLQDFCKTLLKKYPSNQEMWNFIQQRIQLDVEFK